MITITYNRRTRVQKMYSDRNWRELPRIAMWLMVTGHYICNETPHELTTFCNEEKRVYMPVVHMI